MTAYKHFTIEDRVSIEKMLNAGERAQAIADAMGVHNASVYREIKRGQLAGKYDAIYADSRYRERLQEKGAPPKLEKDTPLVAFISQCLLERGLSPAQIVGMIKEGKTSFPKDAVLSRQTIYAAIDSGFIPNVTREMLLAQRKATMFSDGHIIIPKWVRNSLNLKDGDSFEIDIVSGTKEIIIRKSKFAEAENE